MIDNDSYIFRHTDAQFPESLQSALSHLVAAQQHGLGQSMFLHGLLGQCIAALPADLPHVEGAGIVLAALLQDTLDSRQAVSTDAAVGPVVDAADIAQAGVPLLIQQIGHHLLLAPVEVHLHLVELIVVLIGVHENDSKGQRAEKVDLFLQRTESGESRSLSC